MPSRDPMTERKLRQQKLLKERQKRINRMIRICIIAGTLIIVGSLLTITAVSTIHKRRTEKEALTLASSQMQRRLDSLHTNNTLTLSIAGNLTFSPEILLSGYLYVDHPSVGLIQSTNPRDFSPLFDNVRSYINRADFSIADLPGLVVENYDSLVSAETSGYYPPEVGAALSDTGFDLLLSASPGSLSKGSTGKNATLQYWMEQQDEMLIAGLYDPDPSFEPVVVNKKNFVLSVFDFCSSETDFTSDAFRESLQNADEASDFVLLFCRASKEESPADLPDPQDLLECGVDLYVRLIPDTLGRYEQLEDLAGHTMLYYSGIGNMLSTKDHIPDLLGGLPEITLKKDIMTGEVQIDRFTLTPFLTHCDTEDGSFTLYRLADYSDALAARHAITLTTDSPFTIVSLQERFAALTAGLDNPYQETDNELHAPEMTGKTQDSASAAPTIHLEP